MLDVRAQDGTADIDALMRRMGKAARAAEKALALAAPEQKARALLRAADVLVSRTAKILMVNRGDVADGEAAGLSAAALDRLRLDDARVECIQSGHIDQCRGSVKAQPVAVRTV